MPPLSSPALLSDPAAARKGDAHAFCRLVEPHEGRLLGQALALCREQAQAEDLVQETLLEAWKSLRRFNETARLSTWLYSILLHRHWKALRYARIRPFFCLNAEERDAALRRLHALEPAPDRQLDANEQAARLFAAVHRLSARQREVVLM